LKVLFDAHGWDDYLHWVDADPKIHRRLNELIQDIRRQPFSGIGKPEPLKGKLAGWWSRRITSEHRLVYRVEGRGGDDQHVIVAQCRHHY
jgi:toxin YoeB